MFRENFQTGADVVFMYITEYMARVYCQTDGGTTMDFLIISKKLY